MAAYSFRPVFCKYVKYVSLSTSRVTPRQMRAIMVGSSAFKNLDDLEANFDARAGIEEVAQCVTDEVEGEHCQHHRQRWKDYEVGRVEQVGAAVVEHGAPASGGRRDSEAEKAHGSFRENRTGHADSGLYYNRLNNVGQDVADDDA